MLIALNNYYDLSSGPVVVERLDTGIYLTNTFNFHIYLMSNGYEIIDEWEPLVDELSNGNDRYIERYGVCDNYTQILEYAPEIESSEKQYIVVLTEVRRDEQPEMDGWRWHKWGEYIGDHEITEEYLYDEEDIEQVYVYHIYEINKR